MATPNGGEHGRAVTSTDLVQYVPQNQLMQARRISAAVFGDSVINTAYLSAIIKSEPVQRQINIELLPGITTYAGRSEGELLEAMRRQAGYGANVLLLTVSSDNLEQPLFMLENKSKAVPPGQHLGTVVTRIWSETDRRDYSATRFDPGGTPFHKAGANGYVPIDASSERTLVESINHLVLALYVAVQGGGGFHSPVAIPPLALPAGVQGNTLYNKLTDRELEILKLLAEGVPNKKISGQLFISENTVRAHVRSLMQKLNAENRTQLAVQYIRAENKNGGAGT